MRGLIGPDTYKQGDRSLFREQIILKALQSEIEYSLGEKYMEASIASMQIAVTSYEAAMEFNEKLTTQIEKLECVKTLDYKKLRALSSMSKASEHTNSVDYLVALYKILSKSDAFEKLT